MKIICFLLKITICNISSILFEKQTICSSESNARRKWGLTICPKRSFNFDKIISKWSLKKFITDKYDYGTT